MTTHQQILPPFYLRLPVFTAVTLAASFTAVADITDSIQHNFTDAVHEEYHDSCPHLDEIVVIGVTGKTRLCELAVPVTYIHPGALKAHPSSNIIDAISRQPGISQVSTGSGISKPVIRGLGYNRVLVVNDGVRQEGQQWGDEHGIEVDGNSINSVEIIKGPASLMYGSDAMAGVIIMNSEPNLAAGDMAAEASAGYQTNAGQIDYSVNFRGNRNGLLWNWRWSQKWAHDYKNASDGYVPNTRFRERALRGMLGLRRDWGNSNLILSYYHITPGLTEPALAETEHTHYYGTEIPYQEVGHYKVVSDNSFYVGDGFIKAIIGYQYNRRKEYEDHHHADAHHGSDGDHDYDHDHAANPHLGLDFRLQTINYDVRYISPEVSGWKFNAGISGMYQRSDNLGEEYLIPAYRLIDGGVFATASRNFREKIYLSGGLRYDLRNLHSLQLTEEGEKRFADFNRNFGALSCSIGAVFNLSRYMSVKANVAHGYRAPNMSELGSNGSHEGTFRYEIGDPQLKAEHSWQFDIGADADAGFVSGSVSLFANRISNFIYLMRTSETVDENPVYRYTSGDACLIGGEAAISIHPLHWLHFHNTLSYVDARQMHASSDMRYLPFTPPLRWLSTLHCDIPLESRIVRNWFAEIEADTNARQNHVMTAGETETPTAGYTLWNFSMGTDIYLPGGRQLCTVTLSASNIFNKAYRSHLSRLKYADTYPITGRYGYDNPGRNISIRITFPVNF